MASPGRVAQRMFGLVLSRGSAVAERNATPASAQRVAFSAALSPPADAPSTSGPSAWPLQHLRGLHSGSAWFPQHSASRQLHSSAAAHESASSAALRRLSQAHARRERALEAREHKPAATAAEGGLVPAPAPNATVVTPREGAASELQLAAALDHSALIVTRPIEWGTVIFGYEQARRAGPGRPAVVRVSAGPRHSRPLPRP
jgi:hypothetical protein